MAIPAKQIGQSPEYYILYEILRKLDAILTGSIKVDVSNSAPIDVTVVP